MAGEIQLPYTSTGATLYTEVRNASGQPWRTDTHVFESYTTANKAHYAVTLTEQGTSRFYTGDFPALISTRGVYGLATYVQAGGSPAEGDTLAGAETFYWTGTAPAFLPVDVVVPANFATLSIDTNGRVKVQTGVSRDADLPNFSFVMTDLTTHAPATGLSVTATRRIGAGSFGPCANPASEVGNGFYTIDLAAADLNGAKIDLRFTATGADDLDITIYPTP